MGNARWDPSAFRAFASASTDGKATHEVFRSRSLPDSFDPSKFAFRESRDSPSNPASTPIGLFCDVTGSMGVTADRMIRHEIDTVMREIDRRRPDLNPHILVGAIGDATCDRAPLQMTQFEAGVVLCDQLKDIWVEGGGGGNQGESYLGAHYAMGMKTITDSFTKRGRKGALFTMGDEPALDCLTKAQIKRVFGVDAQSDLTAAQCLALAQTQYEVFHIVLAGVGYAAHRLDEVLSTWRPLLGERVLVLEDHAKVAEIVVSTLQILSGDDVHDVAASWSGSTSVVVASTLRDVVRGDGRGLKPSRGVRRL